MNSLRIVSLACSLTLALLGTTQAQTPSTQRVEVTAAAATPAIHYGDSDQPFVPFANPRTRESVRAELMAFLASGGHVYAAGESGPVVHFVSSKTRAEVLAEAAASRARGDFVREGDEIVLRQVAPSVADVLIARTR
jgi:hypothetical protein